MSIAWEQETILAIRAVAEGGRLAKERRFEMAATPKESLRDVVTAADIAIESSIRIALAEMAYPVVGEELSPERLIASGGDSPFWAVDPIDGTANYVNGFDCYAVSVGLVTEREFLVGAVCLPERTELFCTLGKDRALLNGRIISHAHRPPSESLIAASFSGTRGDVSIRERQFRLFGDLNDRSRGCLRTGSAASNICLTAAGRFQAAYGTNAKIWDVAGGLAVATRSGCCVWTARSDDGLSIDYIVGSKDTVAMIREHAMQLGVFSDALETAHQL